MEKKTIEIGDVLRSVNKRRNDGWPTAIPKLNAADLSYEEFFTRFMQPNLAVMLTSICDQWDCSQRWIDRRPGTEPRVDVEYLKACIENAAVPIADCSVQYYNSHEKIELDFHDFLDYWCRCSEETTPESGERKLYLKDWHLQQLLPDYEFYCTPPFFASDWLNEYLVENGKDDYRFVYMGPKGTWTAFHADVFGSFSWSVNVFGRKRWLILPPGEELRLSDTLGNLPFRITVDLLDREHVCYYCVEQVPGEAIFVPSGWYHQVENMDHAISVNHNWFNGCNVDTVWNNLEAALRNVKHEIADCSDMDDFENHCQLMLKATFGMNYREFLDIVVYICDKRLTGLNEGADVVQSQAYVMGKRHIEFDIDSVRQVLHKVQQSDTVAVFPGLLDTIHECLQRMIPISS